MCLKYIAALKLLKVSRVARQRAMSLMKRTKAFIGELALSSAQDHRRKKCTTLRPMDYSQIGKSQELRFSKSFLLGFLFFYIQYDNKVKT